MLCLVVLFFQIIVFHTNSSFSCSSCLQSNDGPLFLSKCVKEDPAKAQVLSRVSMDITGVESHSGYFTIDEKCDSNLFFWFFKAQTQWESAPLIIWLQGGPGTSSMFGVFDIIGPFSYNGSKLVKREYSWNVKHNLLFIDQPVDTGFSFTRGQCFAKTETEVSAGLYSLLTQFYKMFPTLKSNKLYLAGESFAGHYIPVLARTIHENNMKGGNIKLTGMMIGNGYFDPLYQNDFGDYLFNLGVIDEKTKIDYKKQFEVLKVALDSGNKVEAVKPFVYMNAYNLTHTFKTSRINPYNYLEQYSDNNVDKPLWFEFLQQPKVKRALHVGSREFSLTSINAKLNLFYDQLISVKQDIEFLLNHYPIVVYFGQLDILCAYPMAANFFSTLEWNGAKQYREGARNSWCVDGEGVGFIKSAGNFHEVFFRSAGHLVPKDQPLRAFRMVNSVTASPPGKPLEKLSVC